MEPVLIFGLKDQNLSKIEQDYPNIRLTARGNILRISGSKNDVNEVTTIITDLIDITRRKGVLSEADVDTVLALKKTEPIDETQKFFESDIILQTYSGESVRAKTPGQRNIVQTVQNNDIVFAIGPAGTGKTYTSVALAVKALKERRVKKIVLCRPAVEAGESLGFLPGGLREKIDPYLRPLYDALEEMIDYESLELNMAKNIIEIAPLAYMRGRTLNNAFVILDEAQNATNMQMKMFLTRLGLNSQAIVTGDITQTDLPSTQASGLISIQQILENIKGIRFVYLDQRDVVRHRLIRDIIQAYDRYEDKNKS